MPQHGPAGNVHVLSDADMRAQEDADLQFKDEVREELEKEQEPYVKELVKFVKDRFQEARDHRDTSGLSERLVNSLRTFKGEYSAKAKGEIRKFSGSEVYSRVSSVKCRGATALLRDVYLSGTRPWRLKPTPMPDTPVDVMGQVVALIQTEVAKLQETGQQPEPSMIEARFRTLVAAAQQAAKKQAKESTVQATSKLDDILVEGGFYDALSDFLIDLPVFPYACIKGPVVRNVDTLKWEEGKITTVTEPRMMWNRVSPFDLFFSPGADNIGDSYVIETIRVTSKELYDLIGQEGYDSDAIRDILARFADGGLVEWRSTIHSQRDELEEKEVGTANKSNLIDALEYTGHVRGKALRLWGMTEEQIPDEDEEYFAKVWVIGSYAIKAQLIPNPRKRHEYYATSFEKIPGSIAGNGVPDILEDIQSVMNASLRSLINNLSIASGPQVEVNVEKLAAGADPTSMYPWKKWLTVSDPTGDANPAVRFFQPKSNAQELLGVYKEFSNMADEISAIPRYMTGSDRIGGAGRTASGLAMLMNNASKVMQNVAYNIDSNILSPLLQQLYDMVMLTDTSGLLRGDEDIDVRGVTTAVQKEQDRVRQLEFLQLTGNPIDMQIMGIPGRATILRSIAETLGLDPEKVIPEDEAILAAMQPQSNDGSAQKPGPNEAQSDGQQPYLDTVSGRNTI